MNDSYETDDGTAIRTGTLTKRYGNVTALDGLDLRVERGEVFGFLGPNGAGKTTTINLLLDYARPTTGTATVLGYDPRAEPTAVHRNTGILPEGFSLYDRLTGREHVRFAIDSMDGDETPGEQLERVGIDSMDVDRPVGEYSRGMQQRLALAMALAGDPALLVLDEPSNGLDPTGIREMQDLVREEAATGTTVFFSSHILGQVEAVCDRVGILDEGELVAVDTIEGLRASASVGAHVELDVDRPPSVDLDAIDGVADATVAGDRVDVVCTDPAAKATVIERVSNDGSTIADVRIEESSLDDLFAAYTEREAVA